MKELRQVINTVTNPEHDKRTRYGQQSVKAMAEGTVLLATYYDDYQYPTLRKVGGRTSYDGKFARAIVEDSIPVEASTFMQWLYLNDDLYAFEKSAATEILDRLWVSHPELQDTIKKIAEQVDREIE